MAHLPVSDVVASPERTVTIPLSHLAETTKRPRVSIAHTRVERVAIFATFCVLMLVATAMLTINIASPWHSEHEDNGNFFETTAINHLRFGLGVTKGQDLLDLGTGYSYGYGPQGVGISEQFATYLTGPVQTQVYGDHPPLLSLTIAGFFSIFGFHYWAERLVVVLYALASAALFFLLIKRLSGPLVALCSLAFFVTFPIFDYYGRDVSHESPTLFWGLALLTGYFYWRDTQARQWTWVMIGAIAIGGFYGWPMFFLAFILFVVDWVTRRKFDKRLLLFTIVPAIVTFALVIGQLLWALDGDVQHLIGLFLFRSSSATPLKWSDWLFNVRNFNLKRDFGPWNLYAMVVGLAFLIWRVVREGWKRTPTFILICGLWGLCHMLVFREGSFIHDYWQYYLLPFYAALYGWAIIRAVQLLLHRLPQLQVSSITRSVALAVSMIALCFGLLALSFPISYMLFTFRHTPFHPLF